MNPEQHLAELEQRLRSKFGCWTRYQNDLYEQHGDTATIEERLAVAEKVLRVGPLGNAAHQFECLRRDSLGRPLNTSD